MAIEYFIKQDDLSCTVEHVTNYAVKSKSSYERRPSEQHDWLMTLSDSVSAKTDQVWLTNEQFSALLGLSVCGDVVSDDVTKMLYAILEPALYGVDAVLWPIP